MSHVQRLTILRSGTWLLLSALIVAAFPRFAAPAQAGPQRWAVVVGVDRYDKAQIPALKYAGADAQAVAKALRGAARFPNDHVYVLTSTEGETPTSEHIL